MLFFKVKKVFIFLLLVLIDLFIDKTGGYMISGKEVSVGRAYSLYEKGEYKEAAKIYKKLGDIYGRAFFEINIRLCKKFSLQEGDGLGFVGKTIFFVSDHTYLPYRSGGRESSINDLAAEFRDAGWNVYVIVKKNANDIVEREFNGYTVVEVDDVFSAVVGLALYYRVDRIVASVDGKNIEKFLHFFPSGSCLFVRDTQGLDFLSENDKEYFKFVSNSEFTASEVEKRILSRVEDFPPLIDTNAYKVLSSKKYVVFVNTVEKKGLSLAIDIARSLPDIQFLFREGWPLSDEQWQELKQRICDISNIELERATNDVKSIYNNARLLIVPSQCEEAWGRVVTEAQVSGIPTIVNGVGGLSESCGVGGIVMARDSSYKEWATVIERVLSDDYEYNLISEGALRQTEKYKKLIMGYRERFEETIQPGPSTLCAVDMEANLIAHQIKDGKKVRELLSLDSEMSVFVNKDLVKYVFEMFYHLQAYSMALFIYEENINRFPDSNDVVFALAQCYTRSKKFVEASNQWGLLCNSEKNKATPFQIKMYADCLFYSGDYLMAKNTYLSLLDLNYKDDGWLYKAVVSAIYSADLTAVKKFEIFCGHSDSKKGVSQKYIAIIFFASGDYVSALSSFYFYLSEYETAAVEDYAFAVYLSVKAENYAFAVWLSEKAGQKFPKSYKGPEVLKDLADVECSLVNIGYLCEEYSKKTQVQVFKNAAEQKNVLVCSWPGLLYGNRFMELLRNEFVSQNIGFLPINMPSCVVVTGAKVLIIQWPDVLKWRNHNLDLEKIKELMKFELNALKKWKEQGVDLVWLVHNLLPHDLSDKEIPVWKDFFNSIGSLVDRYVSMSQAAEKEIYVSVPALRNKGYNYFYHPLYEVKKYPKALVESRREELGVKKDDFLIASLGMIGRYKGIIDLIEGFLLVQNQKSKLLIAGRSRDLDISQAVQEVSDKDDRVIFFDQFLVDDDFDLLANIADLIVVPNKHYLNSGALIYAISAGKPVLALNRPFASEMSAVLGVDSPIVLVDSFVEDTAVQTMSNEMSLNKNFDLSLLRHRSPVGVILG